MSGVDPTLKDIFPIAPPAAPQSTLPESARETAAPDLPLDDAVAVKLKDAAIAPAALASAVQDSLGTFLDIRFSTVIAGAWAKAASLRQYRDKSLAEPDETFLLSMAKHSIQSKYKPSIEMLVNGTALDSLPFEIVVQLALEGLVLTIKNGRITELRLGKCQASGKIGCRGYPLFEQKSRSFAAPGALTLGQGVPIGVTPAGTAEASNAPDSSGDASASASEGGGTPPGH